MQPVPFNAAGQIALIQTEGLERTRNESLRVEFANTTTEMPVSLREVSNMFAGRRTCCSRPFIWTKTRFRSSVSVMAKFSVGPNCPIHLRLDHIALLIDGDMPNRPESNIEPVPRVAQFSLAHERTF